MGGDDGVERAAARQHAIVLTVRPDMALIDDIRRNEPVFLRVRLSDVEHVVIDRERARPRGRCAGTWHRNFLRPEPIQPYICAISSNVSCFTLAQLRCDRYTNHAADWLPRAGLRNEAASIGLRDVGRWLDGCSARRSSSPSSWDGADIDG